MSHLLVIPFADEKKAREGVDKLVCLQKRGSIEIEDAIIAVKNENGAVELKQVSNESSFWETRAAVSGYPAAPTAAGALTDLGGNEKFVKELAEAMPLGRGAVFVLLGKTPERAAFEGSTGGEKIVFFNSLDKSAAGAVRTAFAKWKGNGQR